MSEGTHNSKSAFEQAIRHEKELELIYNTVTDVIYMIDVEHDGKFRFASINQAFLSATGLQSSDVVGKYLDQVIPPASIDLVLGNYRDAIRTASSVTWEEVSVYPSGTKYGLVTVTPVFDENGVCVRMVGSVHDITEKKEKDLAISKVIKEREDLLAQLLKRNEDLEQYTYIVSHNLRAPVANIMGLAEVLKTTELEINELLSVISDLSESAIKLDNVIIELNTILQPGK
ncbi:PAS domain-containing protein [Daejeonella lutea]|uniref:histidine kinase n=1 Tax=Daejeonella lutea TaxID=572036 RepID=A0A1T5BVE8_9SPHI|nr:PAS domain S-box protein [Daejeonella lutea]SKB51127.1 PAS domain S-box-containing protein [Daejeonella lutea]